MSAHGATYRTPIFGPPEPIFARAWRVAGAVGLAVLAIGLLFPLPKPEPVAIVEPTAERVAKLVLSRSTPPPPAAQKAIQTAAAAPEIQPEPVAAPPPMPAPRVDSRPRVGAPKVAEDRGTTGRARAKEATQQLAATTASIDGMLSGLDQVLASSTPSTPSASASPRRRAARGGRSASQVGAAGALPAGGGTDADGSGSAIAGARIEIAALGAIEGDGVGGGGSGSGSSGGKPGGTGTGTSGDLRSDASLLAVVRKYAAGIRFCYENELKKNPSLGGKLVVAITVAASGKVANAVIVQDTLGAAPLTSCAVAQIQAWRFPAIPSGDVTFRAPFVFTPPE